MPVRGVVRRRTREHAEGIALSLGLLGVGGAGRFRLGHALLQQLVEPLLLLHLLLQQRLHLLLHRLRLLVLLRLGSELRLQLRAFLQQLLQHPRLLVVLGDCACRCRRADCLRRGSNLLTHRFGRG